MNPIEALSYMDKVLAKLENPQEQKKREDERAKENAHRKDEGLDSIEDYLADRREYDFPPGADYDYPSDDNKE